MRQARRSEAVWISAWNRCDECYPSHLLQDEGSTRLALKGGDGARLFNYTQVPFRLGPKQGWDESTKHLRHGPGFTRDDLVGGGLEWGTRERTFSASIDRKLVKALYK